MADDPTDHEGSDPEPPDKGKPDKEPGWARELRKQNEQLLARNKDLEAKVADRDKADLFAKIGIPDKGAGALFRKTYNGELTEEAIRKEALDYELIQPERTTPTEERDVLARIQDATAGTTGLRDVKVPEALIQQIEAAKDNDEIDKILESHGLLIRDS